MTDGESTEQREIRGTLARIVIHAPSHVKRAFFPAAIAGAIVALSVMSVVSDAATVIKGSYSVLGLVVAASIYYTAEEGTRFSVPIRPSRLGKLTAVLIVMTIPVTLYTGSRLPALLVAVPLGYLFVWIQIGSASPVSLLAQLTGLYLVSPVTKLLTSGLYYENGDVFAHVHYVNLLLLSGRLGVIPRYDNYPGYHLLTGTVSVAADLSPYHAMVVVQLVLFAAVVPTVYLLARTVFDSRRLAVLSAFALTATYVASRYVTIYYPESMAVALVVFLLFLSFRIRTATGRTWWALITITGILIAATTLTHHLTLFIYMPFIVIVVFGGAFLRRVWNISRIGPRLFPLAALNVVAVSYWLYERQFLLELVFFVTEIFSESVTSTGTGWRTVVGLGRALPPLTPQVAARSLLSAEGIYFILLVAAVALGIVEVLSSTEKYRRALHLIAVGALATPLLLRTPIFPDVSRIRFPLAVFFVFLLTPSLERLSKAEFHTKALRAIPLILVVVLATTGVLVASQDLYALNAGPDLYELRPLPEPQVDFSQTELRELRATGRFIDRYGGRASTLAITGRALGMFGVGSDGGTVMYGNLRTERDLFVYRTSWTDHRVSFVRDSLTATVVMSDVWLNRTIRTENKVYTAGGTGILWNPNDEFIGPSIHDTNATATRSA